MAFVGAGSVQVVSLDLNNRNGASLAQAPAAPGLYWDLWSSNNVDYRLWYKTDQEVAPVNVGQLLEIDVLSSDSAQVVATKTANAINTSLSGFFSATVDNDLVVVATNNAGASNAPTLGTLNTGGGNAVVNVDTAGVAPTGNFLTLQQQLISNAQQGLTSFTVSLQTSYNPVFLVANQGNNLYLKSYLAGIQQALADQQIYNYECNLSLNTDDTLVTAIDFNFTFQVA